MPSRTFIGLEAGSVLTECRYYALHRPLCWTTDFRNCGSGNCSNFRHAVDLLGEASRQSSSLIRCDHSSVSYCGVLTFEVETFSELTEHRTAIAWVLVIGRVAAKPQAQLASAPEGSVILSLSLGGVGKLISAPRPKVTAAERQVQLAHPPVQMRAHEPPSQPTEMWVGGCETDFVVTAPGRNRTWSRSCRARRAAPTAAGCRRRHRPPGVCR